MRYNPRHCWDCGELVIAVVGQNHMATPNLRQVKFGLPDGSYHESPFCVTCANRPWTPERVSEFESAVRQVMPSYPGVKSVEGHDILRQPIAGIFS